jgi:hypothetical protein
MARTGRMAGRAASTIGFEKLVAIEAVELGLEVAAELEIVRQFDDGGFERQRTKR